MRLLIIRHGESEADILDVHEGRADFNLTEKGHAQAQAMADYLKDYCLINKIYASPLKRAFQTATHLSEAISVPDLPVHASVYEQESKLEFRYRAEYVLSKIIAENDTDSTVAIVSHGGMINQLYQAFLKLPVSSGMTFATGDTGIHEWMIKGEERYVLKANSMTHLVETTP